MGHRERAADRAGALRILGMLGDQVETLTLAPERLVRWIQDRTLEEMGTLPPPNSGPATSRKAAAALSMRAGSLRVRALQVYGQVWRDISMERLGAITDEEVGEALGHPRIWPRCSELRAMGLIEPTGIERVVERTGQVAECCRITEAGIEVLRNLGVAS